MNEFTEVRMSQPTPIESTVAKWHQHLRGQLAGGLDELLHDDVVFLSPIVFTPQEGKELTKLYLGAAFNTLGGDGSDAVGQSDGSSSSFRYVKEVVAGNHAMLEFETSMDGKYVNGVDIITCDDDGKITEFKVMIRPLQAVNAVHAAMKAMLEQMAPPSP
jgi:hypothetical protein